MLVHNRDNSSESVSRWPVSRVFVLENALVCLQTTAGGEIALPLLCYRRERLRSGRTVERSTWDRIKALEALQRSNKIVTYEDFLKGETMQVQVDSVQFIQDTPGQSSADMADPGGFLRVTLKEAVF